MIQYISRATRFTSINSSDSNTQLMMFRGVKTSLILQHHIIISCFLQPPTTIMITHSCMLMSLASIMPTLFLLNVKAYKFTKLDGLNFYGSDGISTKAQTCNGVTQDWIGSLSPLSLLRVPSDLWTHTMCYTLVTSYPLSPMASGIRMKLGYLAACMTCKIGLGIMWTSECKHAEVRLIHWYFYLNSFVDQDMVMRYHWGLAIGHTYAHNRPTNTYNTSTASESTQVNNGDGFPDIVGLKEPEFTLKNLEDNFIPEEIWDDDNLLVATGYDGDVDFDVYWEMYGWHCFCFQWAKAFELVSIWSLIPLFQASSFHISLQCAKHFSGTWEIQIWNPLLPIDLIFKQSVGGWNRV